MAVTQTYCDYGTGNDYNGASFVDGAFTVADMTLTKAGAFTKSKANHWLYLTDNGSGQVTPGYYKIASVTSVNAVVLATSPKSGATDPTDVKCTQATGTALLPFRSVQGALDIITRDATNGDQINIKAGTAQVSQAALTLATYGATAEGVPLILRGYTAAANDGGVGEIDCNGATMWAAATYVDIAMADLQIHNFGNANGVALNAVANRAIMFNCQVHKGASSPSTKYLVGIVGWVIGCYIHDAGTTGIGLNTPSGAFNNYIVNCTTGISLAVGGIATGNIVDVPSGGTGITCNTDSVGILNNTIYSSVANTGTGINASASAGKTNSIVFNNVVEGFSGAAGKGIATSDNTALMGYNAFFNNTTPTSLADVPYIDLTAHDVTLLASPFTNAGGANFAVSTALKALGYPALFLGSSTNDYVDIGAAQRQEPAGGAVSISPSLGSVGAA